MSETSSPGLLAGLIGPKRQWWTYKARVKALPDGYRGAVDAIERYLMHFGPMEAESSAALLDDVADLFEQAAAAGTPVREIVGEDPVEFVDALIRNYRRGGYIDRERERLVGAIDAASRLGTEPTAWSGLVQVEDTALYVSDTGGPGVPVVYLNGSYADHSHWRRVVGSLGDRVRHIRFDERARGRSATSADYSFEACLRDLSAVLAARRVDRAVLVGWSYGGVLAWHWADRFPDRVQGVVVVDAFPVGLTGEEGRRRIRELFGRMKFLFPVAAWLGLAARMSGDQHAEVNIELNEISAASGPVLERLRCPVRFILGSGDSLGTSGGEMDAGRASLDPLLARNPMLRIGAKVESSHTRILRADAGAVADAVLEVVGEGRGGAQGG